MSQANPLRESAPPPVARPELTRWLQAWQQGDAQAAEVLLPLVYAELHRIAARQLAGERSDHTLQPTALVNEAYLRLVGQSSPWQTRSHFFAIAAQVIRRVLTDHARRVRCGKRGHGLAIRLEDAAEPQAPALPDFDELDLALSRLEALDPLKARIVERRYFGGLKGEEIAELEGISPATVQRHWQLARAWLYRELKKQDEGAG